MASDLRSRPLPLPLSQEGDLWQVAPLRLSQFVLPTCALYKSTRSGEVGKRLGEH